VTGWKDMAPAQRCEVLNQRMQARRERHPEQQRPHPWPGRLARARQRRERIEAERADWGRLVVEHRGCIRAIAQEMGAAPADARRALWDLGLWPMVVQMRERQSNAA